MLPGSAAGGRGRGAGPPAKPSSAARRSSQSSSSAAPAAEALEAGNANGGASASSGCALSTAELKVLLSAAQRLFQPCPRCFNAAGGTRNAHTCFLDLNQITAACSGGGNGSRPLDEDDDEAVKEAADAAAAAACCHNCARDGAADGGRQVQIRRNTYCDVLRAADAAALYDIGGVQQFSINGHKVVFLHARPQKSKPGAVSECGHCHRSLMDAGSRHCSLECKLNWQQRAPPLTQEQVEAACTAGGDPRQLKIPRRLTGDEPPPQHQPPAPALPPPPSQLPLLPPPQQQSAGPHSSSPFAVAGASPWQQHAASTAGAAAAASAAAAGAAQAGGGSSPDDAVAHGGGGIGSGGASGRRSQPRRRSTGQMADGFYLGLSGGIAGANEPSAMEDTAAAASWAAELEPGAAASDVMGAAVLLSRLQHPPQHGSSRPPRPPQHGTYARPPALPRPGRCPAAATGLLPTAAGAYGGQIPRSQGAGAAAAGGATASGCTEDKRGLEQGEAEPPPQSQPRRWREDAGTVGAAANSAQLLLQGGTSCTTSSGGRVAVPLATNAVLRTEHVDLARFLLDQLRARGISCGMPPPSITAVPLPAAEGGMGGGISSGATAAGAAAVNRRRMSASDVGPPPPAAATSAAGSDLQRLPLLLGEAAVIRCATGPSVVAAPVASAAAVGARPAAAGSDARSGTARHGGGMGLKRRSASMDLGEVFRQQPNFSVTAAAGAASGGYGCGYGGGSATAVNDDFSEVTSPHRFGGRGQRPAGPQAAHGAGRGVIGAAGSAPAAAAEADALAAHMALLSPSRLQRPLLPWERRVPAAAAGGLGEAAAGGSDGHMTAGSLTAAVAAWSRSRRGSGDLFGTWVGTSLPGGLPSQPAGAQMEPAVTTSSNDDGEQATGPRRVKARKGQPHQAALA